MSRRAPAPPRLQLNTAALGESADLREWLSSQLRRAPADADFLEAARQLYVAGAFSHAASCLESSGLASGGQAAHLLGYCYKQLGRHQDAVAAFLRCVPRQQEDWQLVVELLCEMGS